MQLQYQIQFKSLCNFPILYLGNIYYSDYWKDHYVFYNSWKYKDYSTKICLHWIGWSISHKNQEISKMFNKTKRVICYYDQTNFSVMASNIAIIYSLCPAWPKFPSFLLTNRVWHKRIQAVKGRGLFQSTSRNLVIWPFTIGIVAGFVI